MHLQYLTKLILIIHMFNLNPMSNKFLHKVRTPRIKALIQHPSKPLIIAALYDGTIHLVSTTDFTTTSILTISTLPLRTLAFYKHYLLIGCDDGNIYTYENNKLKHTTHAHKDFIRKIISNNNIIVSCSDDFTIKMWHYNEPLQLFSCYEGHTHFVMDLAFVDSNQFVSASLDNTVKLFHVGAKNEMLTLRDHSDGVNGVNCSGQFIYSVSDDLTMKIWDNYKCVYTIRGHSKNVNRVRVFDNAIMTCSEDGYLKVYNKKTWVLELSVNVGMERVWDVVYNENKLFVACDEGLTVMSYGRECLHTMIAGDKIYVCINENLKVFKGDMMEKDLSYLDYVPQSVKVQGKFVAIGYNGEYCIYNVLGFRYKAKGRGEDFTFLNNGYCVRDAEKVSFYDESHNITASHLVPGIKRLIGANNENIFSVIMRDSEKTCLYIKDDCVFILESHYETCLFFEKYVIFIGKEILVYAFDYDVINDFIEQGIDCTEINDHYQLISRINKKVNNFYLHDNILFFTSNTKLCFVTISDDTFDYQVCTIEGRFIGILHDNIVYFDKKILKKPIDFSFIRWQMSTYKGVHSSLPIPSQESKAVEFLIHLQEYDQALQLTSDPNTKFDLLVKMEKYEEAKKYCITPQNYKSLTKIFIDNCEYEIAAECALLAGDYNTLYALNVIVEEKYENKIRNGCTNRNLEFWNEFCSGNKDRVAKLLNGSIFYDVYVENWMDVSI